LINFFKASNFKAHACCQAQGEAGDEILGSCILVCPVFIQFLHLRLLFRQKCTAWSVMWTWILKI